MIISGGLLEKVSKIYELYFKSSRASKGYESPEINRKDEVNFSVEGKKKLFLEEVVLDSLRELSTTKFEGEKS